MKLNSFLLLIHLILSTQYVCSQNIHGLWLVEKVQAGNDHMTPVSKWFELHENGEYESGNGWLQNTIGLWSYEPDSREFTATNTLGIKDEAEPFKVEFSDETMVWTRIEEGMNVKVHLHKIAKIPPSYTDLLSGLWQLTEETEQNKKDSSGTLDALKQLFIRWDRIYRSTDHDNKNKTGYWHVNGHKPELTFLPHQSETPVESWHVEVSEKYLKLTGVSDTNKGQVKKFLRIHQFPN